MGQLITSGAYTVTATVTDANGDTASQTFTWTVTGTDIAPPTGINVRIDWGQASFSNPNADVTGYIVSAIRARRGRDTSSAILGRTKAGRLDFELRNHDGRFDQENTASPLAGLIRPGIRVQLRYGGTPLWTGILDSIPTRYKDTGEHRAIVTALGAYSTLPDASVLEGSFESETTAQAFCTLLENIGECATPTGTFYTMPRWWETGSLLEAIRNIEDTEGGFVYEAADGTWGFQNGAYRASQSVSQTFSGLAAVLAGEIPIHGQPDRQIAVKDVHNEVVGFVRQYNERTGETVFELTEPVAVALGTTITLREDFEGAAVSALDSTISHSARVNADGSGGNRTAALQLTASIGQFNEVEVEVSYPTGGGFTDNEVYLRSVIVTGTVLERVQPLKVPLRRQHVANEVQAQDA